MTTNHAHEIPNTRHIIHNTRPLNANNTNQQITDNIDWVKKQMQTINILKRNRFSFHLSISCFSSHFLPTFDKFVMKREWPQKGPYVFILLCQTAEYTLLPPLPFFFFQLFCMSWILYLVLCMSCIYMLYNLNAMVGLVDGIIIVGCEFTHNILTFLQW